MASQSKDDIENIIEKIINLGNVTGNADKSLPDLDSIAFIMDKIINLLRNDFVANGINLEGLNLIYGHIQNLQTVFTYHDFSKWHYVLVDAFCNSINLGQIKRNFIIENVKKRINQSYADQISLSSIAEEFHINPNYLSGLFKKETGINFNNYLTHIRIDNSKKMLKNKENYKVYEIANLVGYPNERYFTKIFKTIVGCTPLEYRNHGSSENL